MKNIIRKIAVIILASCMLHANTKPMDQIKTFFYNIFSSQPPQTTNVTGKKRRYKPFRENKEPADKKRKVNEPEIYQIQTITQKGLTCGFHAARNAILTLFLLQNDAFNTKNFNVLFPFDGNWNTQWLPNWQEIAGQNSSISQKLIQNFLFKKNNTFLSKILPQYLKAFPLFQNFTIPTKEIIENHINIIIEEDFKKEYTGKEKSADIHDTQALLNSIHRIRKTEHGYALCIVRPKDEWHYKTILFHKHPIGITAWVIDSYNTAPDHDQIKRLIHLIFEKDIPTAQQFLAVYRKNFPKDGHKQKPFFSQPREQTIFIKIDD